MSSFVLQPFTPASRQHPLYPGTFVAKFNALATSSCVRVLQINDYFYDIAKAAAPVLRANAGATGAGSEPADEAVRRRSSGAIGGSSNIETRRPRPQSASRGSKGLNTNHQHHQLEEIIKNELRKLVHEIEIAFKDKVRLLNGEFQVMSTNRLVLLRVSHIVFFSDLKKRDDDTSTQSAGACKQVKKTQRPAVSPLSAVRLPSYG